MFRKNMLLSCVTLGMFLISNYGRAQVEVKTWGRNNHGQLGDNNSPTDRHEPGPVHGTTTDAIAVDGGAYHSIAVFSDGTMRAWGWNTYGQLGDMTTTETDTPVSCIWFSDAEITDAKQAACGSYSTYMVQENDSMKSWGYGQWGQLGDGTNNNYKWPREVVGIINARQCDGGVYFGIAVLNDGTVKAWGDNGFGQLGNGTTSDTNEPVTVLHIDNAIQVAGGSDHALALLNDGTIKAWGSNTHGELGDPSFTDFWSDTPRVVPGISNGKAVSAGNDFSLALLDDGTIKAWGKNDVGQLGIGTTSDTNSPVTVHVITECDTISAGYYHALAIAHDERRIYAWGKNDHGQVGDGTTDERHEPVPIELNHAVAIGAAGCCHSLAIAEENPFDIEESAIGIHDTGLQAYPNPFTSKTVISYRLSVISDQPITDHRLPITLCIYDLAGRKIDTILDKELPAGTHTINWMPHKLPKGIYFCILRTTGYQRVKKLHYI